MNEVNTVPAKRYQALENPVLTSRKLTVSKKFVLPHKPGLNHEYEM